MAGGFDQFERDLLATVDPATIARQFVQAHGDETIRLVINAAKAGDGPDGSPYPPYAQSYRQQLSMSPGEMFSKRLVRQSYDANAGRSEKARFRMALAAGNKAWLTLTGTMLNPANFSWQINPDGSLDLVWTAPNDECGVYAEVHNNGLPIGKGGPVKRREFMHFSSRLVTAALDSAIADTFERIVDKFNAGDRIAG
jgi:hypothetical protein